MPQRIEHIDAIARKKQRGVLIITFHAKNAKNKFCPLFDFPASKRHNWEKDKRRDALCNWLTEHHIDWQPCGSFANENSMISYQGEIYIDVPYDENNPLYALVRDYLENPDGTMRFDTMSFWHLSLEKAMENAHHDEPDFWEKWAADFGD